MPITFIDIERQKSSRIAFLIGFLAVLYLFVTVALYLGISLLFFPFSSIIHPDSFLSFPRLTIIVLFSVVVAFIHFWYSSVHVVSSITRALGALQPDAVDRIHRQLMNVHDELKVVYGNSKNIKILIIPSLSMNALAIDDFKDDAVIAITEGLLSRLSRDQMEAVIAHEAYHILCGDCRQTTLASSLFGMYASLLDQMQAFAEEGRQAGIVPSFLPFRILLRLSSLLSMFISREREYRADAAAVRMTRNPMAMAEALYLLSRNWTGGGVISPGIEMLCIVNPVDDPRDESEGWWPDLMSTHPPIMKRISILLAMAHSGFSVLSGKLEKRPAENMSAGTAGVLTQYKCPNCTALLHKIDYENTQVYQCLTCRGTLVDNEKIPRIIARRGYDCTDRMKTLALAAVSDNQRAMSIRQLKSEGRRSMSGHGCPKCGRVMFRTFYSGAYLVEIDRCNICRLTWFDADELEMLQCLIENKITGNIGLSVN